jgi:hypothetical protein
VADRAAALREYGALAEITGDGLNISINTAKAHLPATAFPRASR